MKLLKIEDLAMTKILIDEEIAAKKEIKISIFIQEFTTLFNESVDLRNQITLLIIIYDNNYICNTEYTV
jgi:hypothetical protein